MIVDLVVQMAVAAVICWVMLAAIRVGDQADDMDPAWRAAHDAVKGTPDAAWLDRQRRLADRDRR